MSQMFRNLSKMVALDNKVLQSKFRGSLLGGLLGDCLGAPYEGEEVTGGEKIIIQRYFDKLENEKFVGPYRQYTDDTAMMKSMAKFLIENHCHKGDYKYLAKLFVNEYFTNPKRGYGQNVLEVFHKLKNAKYSDIFQPASEQFWGGGSYGNGGAMRIAPVALYFHNDYKKMLEVAAICTKITHSNQLGINGALLQCMAVHQSLRANPEEEIDPGKFCSELRQKIKVFETSDSNDNSLDVLENPYEEKLKLVEKILSKGDKEEIDVEVICNLGNGVSAYESVPTAIYCFLRAQKEISCIKSNNIFRRTIQYAVTLGGDTDTIASMAGAIAGAYVGETGISKYLVQQCEFSKEVTKLADDLCSSAVSST